MEEGRLSSTCEVVLGKSDFIASVFDYGMIKSSYNLTWGLFQVNDEAVDLPPHKHVDVKAMLTHFYMTVLAILGAVVIHFGCLFLPQVMNQVLQAVDAAFIVGTLVISGYGFLKRLHYANLAFGLDVRRNLRQERSERRRGLVSLSKTKSLRRYFLAKLAEEVVKDPDSFREVLKFLEPQNMSDQMDPEVRRRLYYQALAALKPDDEQAQEA